MNYYYDPEIAAEVAAYVNYISPVVGAKEAMVKIDPELADNQLIFPDADDAQESPCLHDLTAGPGDRPSPRDSRRCSGRLMAGRRRTMPAPTSTWLGITKRFGAFTAVDDLNLTIPAGLVLRAARAVRLRQDDDAAHGRRPRGARPPGAS